MQILHSLTTLLLFLTSPLSATGPSALIQPSNGTHVFPGKSFAFEYRILADYCQSSFNFSVYLFTSKPTSLSPAQTWATGHYFGRYSIDNYPGNPFPTNPPPARLLMPDFSKSPGGFGTGQSVSNKKVWLVVLEETATCQAAVGVRFALRWAELLYNVTSGPSYPA